MARRPLPPEQIKTPSIKIGIQEGPGGSTPPAPRRQTPAVSLIFLIDPNRLGALAPGLNVEEAVEELVGAVRQSLGKTGAAVQIDATVRSLTGVSAHDLMMAHRQIDLDVLPTGNFAAEHDIARATTGSGSDRPTAAHKCFAAKAIVDRRQPLTIGMVTARRYQGTAMTWAASSAR